MRKKYNLFPFFILLVVTITVFLFFQYRKIKGDVIAYKIFSQNETWAKNYEDSKLKFYVADKDLGFEKENAPSTTQNLTVHAKKALSVDITTGKILFDKASEEKSAIASLTKIMTAVIALEHKKLDSEIVVSSKAAGIGENSMGISEGETYTLEDLLYGLILHSGNDSAYAVAEGVAGSSEQFVYWMNLKASELGLTKTQFFDPSGLDDKTYSTAYDLVKLTRYALKNPDFKRIVGTIEYEIPRVSGKHKYLFLSNQTNLLRTYPGVHGVKTGYTEVAGLCLVTYADNFGHEIVAVVLESNERKIDMIQILDYSFGKLGFEISHPLLSFP